MPNFDAGTYFLTTLAPIKAGPAEAPAGESAASHVQRLRQVLATLPTARQSPATKTQAMESPFARNLRNHFCRFVVIEDVVYNGREGSNAVVASIRNEDPINPKPVDRLNSAYLLFAAEIDAVKKDGEALPATLSTKAQNEIRDAYARELWATAEPEIRRIYDNCFGFDSVHSAEDFAAYLARCQVETTMPFHDYWTSPPNLSSLPTIAVGSIAGLPLAAFVITLLIWPFDGASFWSVLGTAVIALIGVAIAYAWVMMNGRKPFPPPEGGDLPSVLKSLYLQRHFTAFVGQHQTADDEAMHAAFGRFVDEHQPAENAAPTQPPAVVALPD